MQPERDKEDTTDILACFIPFYTQNPSNSILDIAILLEIVVSTFNTPALFSFLLQSL